MTLQQGARAPPTTTGERGQTHKQEESTMSRYQLVQPDLELLQSPPPSRQQQVRQRHSDIPPDFSRNAEWNEPDSTPQTWITSVFPAACPASRESPQYVKVRRCQTGVSWRQRWPISGVSPSHSLSSPRRPQASLLLSLLIKAMSPRCRHAKEQVNIKIHEETNKYTN